MVATEIRVIYGDTDRMGVVYYANYLRYFEAGRNEYIRARGTRYRDIESGGLLLPVVEASVRYHRPAQYDDLLRIEVRLTELRKASLRFSYRVVRTGGEELLATGNTVHACVNRDGRPVRMPEEVRALLDEEPS